MKNPALFSTIFNYWFGFFIKTLLGHFEQAIVSYDRSLEFKDNDFGAWYNRSIALDDLGRYEEAVASYNKALEIEPDSAWLNQGAALLR